MTTTQMPPSTTHEPVTYEVSSIPLAYLFVLSQTNHLQSTNLPPISNPRHRPALLHRSPAKNTAPRTADHPYPRVRFNSPAPSSSHTQPHGTHQWPNPDVVASTPPPHVSPAYSSPEASSPYSQYPPQRADYGADQYDTVPENEQSSSPMTLSPHTVSNPNEFAPQPDSFEQKSVETHSGKKRHKCDVCGSYWGRPSSLKIHMVSHTGVKGAHQRSLSGSRQS